MVGGVRKTGEVVCNQRTNIDDAINGYMYRKKVDTTIWRWNRYVEENDTQKDSNSQ